MICWGESVSQMVYSKYFLRRKAFYSRRFVASGLLAVFSVGTIGIDSAMGMKRDNEINEELQVNKFNLKMNVKNPSKCEAFLVIVFSLLLFVAFFSVVYLAFASQKGVDEKNIIN